MERDWGNRKRERKWREISSFSLHSLFLSPLSHFLYISSPFSHSLAIFSFSCYFLFLSPFPQFLSISKIDQSLYAQIYCWSALWTNSSRTRTLEGMVHGACIILMRHASIHRMNQKQWRDFKRRRANLALLMKNNEETSKEEEQTWLCWCLNKDILFLMCCSLLAASIYGLSRECRENLNIRCMRKWFWIRHAARKPRNSRSPD